MRIISGKYKKANLFAVPGKTARPTTDFIKELIFSVIYECKDDKVLDLFAGSGSLGLEALSRNAKRILFVDFSAKSIQTIKRNIDKLQCREQCKIYRKKVSSFLKTIEEKFDLIFLDPPYNKNLVNETVELVLDMKIMNDNGKVVIEHSRFENIKEEWNNIKYYEKTYGDTTVTVLKKN